MNGFMVNGENYLIELLAMSRKKNFIMRLIFNIHIQYRKSYVNTSKDLIIKHPLLSKQLRLSKDLRKPLQ